MSEKELLDPDPTVATDNLGIRTRSLTLALILGAKFPPPPPPPPPQEEPPPRMPPPRAVPPNSKKFVLGCGRRP